MRTILATLFATCLSLPAFAEDQPLKECYEQAETRLDVGPCLDHQLQQAEGELAEIVKRTKREMRALAQVTGRLDPVLGFEGAQREFQNFRAINCAWYFEQMSPGTGAGDAQKACRIKLTRYRTRELRDLLPDETSPD